MTTATYSVRMDEKLKSEFDELCDEVGMNFSTAITMYAKQAVAEKRFPLTLSARRKPSDYGIVDEAELTDDELKAEIQKGLDDIDNGRIRSHEEVFSKMLGREYETV